MVKKILFLLCVGALVGCGPDGGGQPDAWSDLDGDLDGGDADGLADGGGDSDLDGDPDIDDTDGDDIDACRPERLAAALSQVRLRETLVELTSLPERASHANQEAAAQMLERRLRDAGLEPVAREYTWRGERWVNLEADIPGLELPGEIYAMGAHYDSTSSDLSDAPGADDNGAGSAGVVEAARVLSACSFRRTIRLIFFSNEEAGAIGSAFYAQGARERGDDIRAFLNLDMIAYGGDDEDLDVATRPAYTDLAERVESTAQRWAELDVVTHIDDHCG